MSKVTILPYESPRCVDCGRDLPKGRRQKCYICRPPKSKLHTSKAAQANCSTVAEYSIEDCCALSWAYGISYGRVRAIIDNKLPWPPRIRPLVWPEGSSHAGK